jgi:aquaporin Z
MTTAATTTTVVTRRRMPELSARVLFAEFGATTLLCCFGYWAIYSGGRSPWALTQGALAFGIGLFVTLLVFGRWGVHANPLVSLGAATARTISFADAGARSLAQLAGALVAIVLMSWRHGAKAQAALYGTPLPLQQVSWLTMIFVGALAGFGFVLAALWALDRLSSTPGIAAVLGLALYVAIFFSAAKAGGGMNTARDIAPMFFSGIWAVPGPIGELLGAALAGLLYRRIAVSSG